MTIFSSRDDFKPRRERSKFALGTLGAAVVLAGCAHTTPPAAVPRALVYGAVGSPILDALRGKVALTPSDGGQQATDYDMVIVDGDSFTGQTIKEDQLLRDAMRRGAWVLGLDVTEDDKQGFKPMLHAASQGNVAAYLVRRTFVGRQPVSRMIDFVNPRQLAESTARKVMEYTKQAYTEQAYTRQKVVAQQDGPGDIPARAQTYLWHHTSDYSGVWPEANAPAFNGANPQFPTAAAQTVTWTVDHYVTELLDAHDVPSGDFQHVVVETDARADPGPLAINFCSGGDDDDCEIAWFQTRFDASHTIQAGSTSDKTFILQDTHPTTVNSVQTVTTGTSFNVGFSKSDGVFGNFTYSNSVTHDISQWQVFNVSGSAAAWQYASVAGYNGMITDGYDPTGWQFSPDYVKPVQPNGLSLDNLQYNVKSHWENNAVSGDTLNVGGTDSAWYTDAFAADPNYYPNPPDDSSDVCTAFSCSCIVTCQVHQYMARYNDAEPWGLSVDMGVVIPVPTQSLTFSPNPAVAGQTVTATLKLAAPTPTPAEILITSDQPGITPEHDSYTIPAGEDTLTFKVLTGDQGCQPQSATIQAFFADGQNAVLNVTPPPNCP